MALTIPKARLPRLLALENGIWREERRLYPTASDLHLKLNAISQAGLTMDPADVELAMHAFVEIYTTKGSAGIYRVTTPSHRAGVSGAYTLQHAIDTLNDCLWKAQTDYKGSAEGFLREILACQNETYWQMGVCEDSGLYKKTGINYDKAIDLLMEFASGRPGYYLDYDFTTWPWTLHWKALPMDVRAEWRAGRNVRSISITLYDKDQCTRLYYTVSPAEGQEADPTVYVLNNTAAQARPGVGIIEKPITIDANIVDDPAAEAQRYLADHENPTIQVTVDGYEYYRQTGDTLDRFDLGILTRCLVEGVGPVRERLVGLVYPDLLGEGEHITAEMANSLPRFSESILQASKAAAAAGRRAAAASTRIEQTRQELRLEFAGAQSAIYSSLLMTAEELEIEFTNGISDLHSQIHLTAEELKTEFQKSESKIYSSIRQTAQDLQAEFGSVDSDLYSTIHASAEDLRTEFHTAQSAIYSYVVQTANGMEAEFGNSLSGAYAHIAASAEEIRTELHASQSSVYSSIRQTAEELQTEFGNTVSGVYASISASASELKTEFSKADSKIYGAIKTSADGIKTEFGNAMSGVYSSISLTASSLESEFHSADSSIFSAIEQQKNRIDLVVSGTDSNATVRAAKIIEAITDEDGVLSSEIDIAADQIYLDATQEIMLGDKIVIENGYTRVIGHLLIANDKYSPGYNVEATNGKLTAHDVQIRSGGSLIFSGTSDGEYYDIDKDDVKDLKAVISTGIKSVSVENNTLILTKFDDTTVNFSKATSVSGEWGSRATPESQLIPDGTLYVKATQTNYDEAEEKDVTTVVGSMDIHLHNAGHWGSASTQGEDVNIYYYRVTASQGSSAAQNETGLSLNVDATARYRAGSADVTLKNFAASGTPKWGDWINDPDDDNNHTYLISTNGRVNASSGDANEYERYLSPTEAIEYGFGICHDSIGLNETTKTIDPGQYIDIWPVAKASKDASHATALSAKAIRITANSAVQADIDVNKGSWGTDSNAGKIEFSPASGNGSKKNVALSFTIPANNNNGSIQIGVVDSASPGSSAQPLDTHLSKTLTLTCDDNNATVKDGGTTVARVPNNKSVGSGYADGWGAAYGKVSLPSSTNLSTAYITIGTPPSTVDGNADQTKYYLDVQNYYAYIRYGGGSSSDPIVARTSHSVYTAGQHSVAPTSATISTSTLNSSTGKREATLTVYYKGPDTTEDSEPLSGVDVTSIYNAGKADGSTKSTYPVTFTVTFNDGHTGTVTADCKDIWNQGASESTVTYVYVYSTSNTGRCAWYPTRSGGSRTHWVPHNAKVILLDSSIPSSGRGYVGYYDNSQNYVTGYITVSLLHTTKKSGYTSPTYGWDDDGGGDDPTPGKTITNVNIENLIHKGTGSGNVYFGNLTIALNHRYPGSGSQTSAVNPGYDSYGSGYTKGSIGTYFGTVPYTSYNATHSSSICDHAVDHKALLYVTYSDNSNAYVLIEFTSYPV